MILHIYCDIIVMSLGQLSSLTGLIMQYWFRLIELVPQHTYAWYGMGFMFCVLSVICQIANALMYYKNSQAMSLCCPIARWSCKHTRCWLYTSGTVLIYNPCTLFDCDIVVAQLNSTSALHFYFVKIRTWSVKCDISGSCVISAVIYMWTNNQWTLV